MRSRTPLRIAFVTETYPPEINGVSLSVARVIEGLSARGYDIQLVRPRQSCDKDRTVKHRYDEVLVPGVPMPRYPGLKVGLPVKGALREIWSKRRPDLVHIVTE